jgi:DNA-binding transcriptional MerR regulator
MVEASLDFPIYSIKAVSHLSGVTEPTLRAWEKRYKVLTPKRTDSGHRRYTKRDIYRVIWLRNRLEEGMSISQASTLLETQSDEALLEVVQQKPQSPYPSYGKNSSPNTLTPSGKRSQPLMEEQVRSITRLNSELLQALINFDEARSGQLLIEAVGLYSPEQLCLEIIQPVMLEIGERWVRNEVTVVAEHFASTICRHRLNAMLDALPVPENGPLILSACAPHEFHELGVIITTYFLRRYGWRVIYLGQDVPAFDLAKDLKVLKPALICFSASRTEAALSLLRDIVPIINEIRGSSLPNLLVAYGGRAFLEDSGLHDLFKSWIYFGDDARQSVRLLEQLLPRV